MYKFESSPAGTRPPQRDWAINISMHADESRLQLAMASAGSFEPIGRGSQCAADSVGDWEDRCGFPFLVIVRVRRGGPWIGRSMERERNVIGKLSVKVLFPSVCLDGRLG